MAIVHVAKRQRYVLIDARAVEDSRLSWEARGILTYLMSKPDDWGISSNHLIAQGRAGRDKIYKILRELETYGYLEKAPARHSKGGQFAGTEWTAYEVPRAENPDAAPDTDLPDTANPHLPNTETEPTYGASTVEASPPAPPNPTPATAQPPERPRNGKRYTWETAPLPVKVERIFQFLNRVDRREGPAAFPVANPKGKYTTGADLCVRRIKDGWSWGDFKAVIVRQHDDTSQRDETRRYYNPETIFRKRNFERILGDARAEAGAA